jgi:hypothetical protein
MKADKAIILYKRLRDQPLWRLLAADHATVIISLLQTYLLEGERSIPASIFYEHISRDLEELRAQGEDLPQTAQAYIADWLAAGYLERRFSVSASEEEYELSAAAASAIRFIMSLVKPRSTATESRLTTVIQQLVRLAEETDPNPETRIETLLAERQRIDDEIKAIQKGWLKPLANVRAVERAREVIHLADELTGDFRRVRDEFEQLNRNLREQVMNNEGTRGEVLDALFAGVDVITESEAGRTFTAFWRLLIDAEQSVILEQALEKVLSREFIAELEPQEKRFLPSFTRILLEQSGMVHEILQHFARSLKDFVQSRDYLEQRRLNQLLKEAQRAALGLKEAMKATDTLEYTLQLTSSRVRSLAQWVLYDPCSHYVESGMKIGETAPIDLLTISELVAQSEIDFRTLKSNIRQALASHSQVSIAEILDQFSAIQGLGSVVGYIALASRHGVRADTTEIVSWQGEDKQQRSARIPTIYFLREQVHEFV